MAGAFFGDRKQIRARAWFVGERIELRALERVEALALAPLTLRAGRHGCAMVFRYGGVVLFELDPAEQSAFLHTLAPFVSGAFEEPESEDAEIAIDPDREEGVDATGTLFLREASLARLQIVAHILAKSAVLSHYEERVADVVDRIEPLAQGLPGGAWRRVRGRELLERISDVLLIQTRTLGRVEVAEKPELTWDEPDLDRLYERLGIEYELRERDLALGRKLELISRTAGTLLELLQNRRSLRVEWYIVILIAIEIVLIVYDIAFAR